MLLAEKVETKAELDRAAAAGYQLFQGYYFSRPVVISKETAQIAMATYSRLWKEISKPNPDFSRLAELQGVKHGRDDPYLAGLFSTMDGSMQTGLPELLEQVNVSESVKEAVLHRGGSLGEILTFIEDYESENPVALSAYLQRKGLAHREILPVYLQAVRYADQMFDLRADAQLASPAALIEQI